jgi:putative tryptophan/tyrosine transport system substrate-binding protein
MVPAVKMIGYLVNPTNPQIKAQISQTEAGARALGVRLLILDASTPSEIEATFKIFVEQGIGALLVDNDALFFNERDRLAALAARHAIPAIYHSRENVEAGGLMSCGATFADAFRLAGTYAGRILKGERPSDLPVQLSARIELILNMKTANALGLTFIIVALRPNERPPELAA